MAALNESVERDDAEGEPRPISATAAELPARKLICHHMAAQLPGWQLSCQALLPAKSSALKLRQEDLRGGNNSVTAEEAQLPAPAASRLGPCCQGGS